MTDQELTGRADTSRASNPVIDFSDVDIIRWTAEHCTRLPVHPRHSYSGGLSQTTHHQPDLGRPRSELIRITAHFGPVAIVHLLREHDGHRPPAELVTVFTRTVHQVAGATGGQLTAGELRELFRSTYLDPGRAGAVSLIDWTAEETSPGRHLFTGTVLAAGKERFCEGTGDDPPSALAAALSAVGLTVDVLRHTEHPGTAYAECRTNGVTRWGAGQDDTPAGASIRAVIAAVNRTGAA